MAVQPPAVCNHSTFARHLYNSSRGHASRSVQAASLNGRVGPPRQGSGEAVTQQEPLILTKGEDRKATTRPLERSSFRKKKITTEEKKATRETVLAERKAYSAKNRLFGAEGPGDTTKSSQTVLIVDGYNVIFYDTELKPGARLEPSRTALGELVDAYAAAQPFRCTAYIVYDALYGRNMEQGGPQRIGDCTYEVFSQNLIADSYISILKAEAKRQGATKVVVVSNDNQVMADAVDLTDMEDVGFALAVGPWLKDARDALRRRRAPASGALPLRAPAAAALASYGAAGPSAGGGEAAQAPEQPALLSSDELEEQLYMVVDSASSGDEQEDDAALALPPPPPAAERPPADLGSLLGKPGRSKLKKLSNISLGPWSY